MKKVLSLIVFAVVMTGCSSTKPIVNLQNEPITAAVEKESLTTQEVENAILEAGDLLGWEGKIIEPGLIESTLNLRKHEAVVDISYTDKDFSINYKSSKNLKYKNGKIHNNYNRWVANLSKSINEQITYQASLTGEEAILKTAQGIYIWQVDNVRKVNAFKIGATGKGLEKVVLTEGSHTIGALVAKRQKALGPVDFKSNHEYLLDYVFEGSIVYFWIKDLTDDVVVFGVDKKSSVK